MGGVSDMTTSHITRVLDLTLLFKFTEVSIKKITAYFVSI
jgi:hypothetical protein